MNTTGTWDARVGDEISIESHGLRGARRVGVIREVLGSHREPYYRVGWHDGRETVLHPGTDAVLNPKGRRRRPGAAAAATSAAAASAPPGEATSPPAARKRAPGPAGLRARAGDRLYIKGHHLGEPVRDAEILEVLGPDGTPPFRVRWWDSGRETVLFPGTDAGVERFRRPRSPAAGAHTPGRGVKRKPEATGGTR